MIPKIIHQVWEGRKEVLPDFHRKLGETWKEHHPDWKYELWNGKKMEELIRTSFPEIADVYFNYKYDVQRWDVIRYLILYKMGGMYADFDYECFEPFDDYLNNNGKCFFAMEPVEHCQGFENGIYFNNALMMSPPCHPFIEHIITYLKTTPFIYTGNKFQDVLSSTGPKMLTSLYSKYENKAIIDFFTAERVSPWLPEDVRHYIYHEGGIEKLEKKLEKAMAIHYFFGSWV